MFYSINHVAGKQSARIRNQEVSSDESAYSDTWSSFRHAHKKKLYGSTYKEESLIYTYGITST